MEKIKILFLTADPSNAVRLRLGQELRDVREKLQLSRYRHDFILESRESVRPGDITQAIFDVEPQIVHFSGHGLNTGELCFEDIQGKIHPVSSDALANLFELVSEQVVCVILNACYSKTQSEAIARHIPFVIGMSEAIGDKAAIVFSVAFYKALGAGRSFEDAYKFARIEIQLEGIPESLTPILHTKETAEDETNASSTKKVEIKKNELLNVLYIRILGTPYAYKVPKNLETVSIGRQRRKPDFLTDEGNDVVIRVPDSDQKSLRISRRHLEVKRVDSEYFVIDRSYGKTKLNGEILQGGETYSLKTQDILQIADVIELEILIQIEEKHLTTSSMIEVHKIGKSEFNLIVEASIGDLETMND